MLTRSRGSSARRTGWKRRSCRGVRGMGWDGMGWDGMGWDGMGWDGMGWDGMGWDRMGWKEMGWDGMGWKGIDRMGQLQLVKMCKAVRTHPERGSQRVVLDLRQRSRAEVSNAPAELVGSVEVRAALAAATTAPSLLPPRVCRGRGSIALVPGHEERTSL